MPRPRKTNTRTYRKTVVALLEGDRTEYEYVKFVKSRLPANHGIEIVTETPGSARRTLHRRAKEIIKSSDEDTEVWIICDVDDEGRTLAQLVGEKFRGHARLRWAISNPEFALWLVMHFQECTKWEDRTVYAGIARRIGVATGNNGKSIDTQKLIGRAADASQAAAAARKRHSHAQRELPANNPQSDVDQFIARVVELCNENILPGQSRLSVADLY